MLDPAGEHIAFAPHGQDQLVPAVEGGELLAQPADLQVDLAIEGGGGAPFCA